MNRQEDLTTQGFGCQPAEASPVVVEGNDARDSVSPATHQTTDTPLPKTPPTPPRAKPLRYGGCSMLGADATHELHDHQFADDHKDSILISLVPQDAPVPTDVRERQRAWRGSR
jgi:hypothetical protein